MTLPRRLSRATLDQPVDGVRLAGPDLRAQLHDGEPTMLVFLRHQG